MPGRKDRFDATFAEVTMQHVDWWSLVNQEKLLADDITIERATIHDYIDQSMPDPPFQPNKFPGQLLLKIPLDIHIKKMHVKDFTVKYEEYNPRSEQQGELVFSDINGVLSNITNMPSFIRRNNITTFQSSSLFMWSVPLKIKFTFNVAKEKTGDFTADIDMGKLNKDVLNDVIEPLGMVSVKSGVFHDAIINMRGNNFGTNGTIKLLYSDLSLAPLKKKDDELKQKTLTGFLANTFLIKNENPSGSDKTRSPEVKLERKKRGFFNLIWKTILKGILAVIGLPEKLAEKE